MDARGARAAVEGAAVRSRLVNRRGKGVCIGGRLRSVVLTNPRGYTCRGLSIEVAQVAAVRWRLSLLVVTVLMCESVEIVKHLASMVTTN
jgi:hypothetical protein